MSDSALAAALRPPSYGAWTWGGKKSVVRTTARSPSMRTTAASSPVSSPTSSSSEVAAAKPATMSSSSPGGSLQAQPPPWANCVSRIVSVRVITLELRLAGGGVWAPGGHLGLQNRCGPGPGSGGFDSRPPPPPEFVPRTGVGPGGRRNTPDAMTHTDPRRGVPRTDAVLRDARLVDASRRLGAGYVRAAVTAAQRRARAGDIDPVDVVEAAVAA